MTAKKTSENVAVFNHLAAIGVRQVKPFVPPVANVATKPSKAASTQSTAPKSQQKSTARA
jgi:hypothetical protein